VPIVGDGKARVTVMRSAIAKHSDDYWQSSLETRGAQPGRRTCARRTTWARPAHGGIDLITSRARGEDGTYCLTLTGGEKRPSRRLTRNGLHFVLEYPEHGQRREAPASKDSLGAFINELGDKDRFEVMTSMSSPHTLFKHSGP